VFDWLLYSLFLVGLTVVIYRLVDLVRAPRRPAMWAMWSGLLMLIFCVAVGLPLWPRSSVGFIVQHVLILGCLAAFELFYLLSIYGGRRRPASTTWFRGVMYGLAAVMVFAWVLTTAIEHPDWADLDYRRYLIARVMVLAYTAGTATSLLSLVRLSWRWSRIADRVWLHRSLVALTISTSLGLAYTVHHFIFTLLYTSGITPPYPQRFEVPLIVAGVLIALIGLSMPAWGPGVTATRRWFQHRAAYRRLEPLWAAFIEVRPEIRLPERGPAWDVEFALYRRVIEIWDGRSRLRGYLDPQLAEAAIAAGKARSLSGDELVAAVEADLWRDALRRCAEIGPQHNDEIPGEPETGDNLADAVRFLELIATAWRHPPLTTSPVPQR